MSLQTPSTEPILQYKTFVKVHTSSPEISDLYPLKRQPNEYDRPKHFGLIKLFITTTHACSTREMKRSIVVKG